MSAMHGSRNLNLLNGELKVFLRSETLELQKSLHEKSELCENQQSPGSHHHLIVDTKWGRRRKYYTTRKSALARELGIKGLSKCSNARGSKNSRALVDLVDSDAGRGLLL